MRRAIEWLLPLALLAAATASAADWPDVPMPDGAKGEWVSKHMIHNGLHMRASRFSSERSRDELVAFYRRQWNGRVVVDDIGGKTVVGHLEGDHFVTIDIRSSGNGAEAKVGIIRMAKEKPRQALGAGFPRPVNTRVINDTQYVDMPGRSVTMHSPLSPQQGAAFYRQRMPGQGWTPDGANTCATAATSCVAAFKKAGQQLLITFNGDARGTAIVGNQIQQ